VCVCDVCDLFVWSLCCVCCLSGACVYCVCMCGYFIFVCVVC